MIDIANVDRAGRSLFLEMAAQTERLVARDQHPGIHGPMRVVACSAAFAHRFMAKNKRPELRRVTLGANFILPHQGRAAADDHRALMRIMAVAATDLAFEDGMMGGQVELGLFVEVTLKTHLG